MVRQFNVCNIGHNKLNYKIRLIQPHFWNKKYQKRYTSRFHIESYFIYNHIAALNLINYDLSIAHFLLKSHTYFSNVQCSSKEQFSLKKPKTLGL